MIAEQVVFSSPALAHCQCRAVDVCSGGEERSEPAHPDEQNGGQLATQGSNIILRLYCESPGDVRTSRGVKAAPAIRPTPLSVIIIPIVALSWIPNARGSQINTARRNTADAIQNPLVASRENFPAGITSTAARSASFFNGHDIMHTPSFFLPFQILYRIYTFMIFAFPGDYRNSTSGRAAFICRSPGHVLPPSAANRMLSIFSIMLRGLTKWQSAGK